MADKPENEEASAAESGTTFSEVVMKKARRWFQQGKQVAETRNYDYGIQCYITGLGFWPEAVEEGHKPLRGLGMQRMHAGGKKPGMMDGLRKPISGKDFKQCMLNAEELLSKDPMKSEYMEGLLKNANKAGFNATVRWIGALVLDALKSDRKPSASRLRGLREILEEAGARMESQHDTVGAVWCYEQAVAAQALVVRLRPDDGPAATELRNLTGRLTIVRGKYSSGDSFRDSLQDADKAKLLHDSDRVVQADDAVDNLIAAARREYEASPGVAGKVYALIEHLLRREHPKEEDEAIRILYKAYDDSNNYNFRTRADDIRLKQLNRRARELKEKAKASGDAGEIQQARKAAVAAAQAEIDIFQDRVKAYPTDLRIRFRLGVALFKSRRFDEAIPILQEAVVEPRSRVQALYHMGRCFFEKQIYDQASAILEDAAKAYEIEGDDTSKAILYWLGRAYEASGAKDNAQTAYGRLLRQDYNYADGDVRKRLEALKTES